MKARVVHNASVQNTSNRAGVKTLPPPKKHLVRPPLPLTFLLFPLFFPDIQLGGLG